MRYKMVLFYSLDKLVSFCLLTEKKTLHVFGFVTAPLWRTCRNRCKRRLKSGKE